MKKTITICIVACVALLAPAIANAGKKNYSGSINPSGKITFELLKKKNGTVKVDDFTWTNLPVDCGGEPQTSNGSLTFKIPVQGGAFKTDALLGPVKNPRARAQISGEINGRKASGKIELTGSETPINPSGTDKCESGSLSWSAKR